MTGPSRSPRPEDVWSPWVARWVLPFLQERAMWPLLVALLGHVVVVLALVVLRAVRDRSAPGMAAFAVIGMLSAGPVVHEVRHLGRPGAVTWTVVAAWGLAGAVAWLAGSTGIL